MSEPAFVGAGARAGLEIWRIESLKPVKVPQVSGKLYTGDSYILLSTVADKTGKLSYTIHFWLGAETSQDEAGTAAYKTVELDDALSGIAVQIREVQGSESAAFLALFKNLGGIEYVPGGIASGFRKVERDVYETRLLWVKGARTVRVTPVPVSNKSLNSGDVFILDLGLKIFVFNGPGANRAEKGKGVEVASRIDSDERGGRADIFFIDDEPKNAEFWGALGGYVDPSKLPTGEPDSSVAEVKQAPKLFQDNNGTFAPVTLPNGKLEKDLLTSEGIFLVHGTKIFLWIGSKANLTQKREATANGIKYIKSAGLPASTALERVSEGVETNTFKGEFAKWEVQVSFKSGIAQARSDTPVDVAALLARKQIEETPFDDGSGKLQIWVVQNFALAPVDPKHYGQFHGGDSYVILYTYQKNKKDNYMLYFWLGDKSTADEKGSAALLTKEKDDALQGQAVQVRVTQGKEPAHFRQLFKGKLIIHAGGKASGFNNSTEGDSYDTDGTALFRIHGSTPLNTSGVQVPEVASSLNSEDSFVLVTPTHAYVWAGNGATADEQAVATNIANLLANDYNNSGGRVIENVSEGSEPGEFWSAIGGQGEYPQLAPGEDAPRPARLFQASNATGSFTVSEVADFTQSDLNDEDVYLLDTYTTVYLWIGSQANETEKSKAADVAKKFIADSNDGRDADTPVVTVHSAAEPLLFTAHFVSWDAAFAESNKFTDPYQAKLDKLSKEKKAKEALNAPKGSAPAPAAAKPAPAAAAKPSASGTYSFDDVKAGNVPGMDLANRENYLDDATFKAKLGTDRAAFAALPKWKRDAKKKEVGIF